MTMLLILLPVSLLLLGIAMWAFIWAVNAGQFDDLDTPGWEVLTQDPHEHNGSNQSIS